MGKAKKSTGWAKYVYVSEICAEGILCLFPGDKKKMWKVGQN